MLICPKCHTENLLTAVFCRNCGEKLDLDKMTPESLQQDSKKKHKGGKLVVQMFCLLLTILVLALVAGSLIPVGGILAGKSPEKKTYRTYIKYASSKHFKNADELTLNDEEASAILTRLIIGKEKPKGQYVPANITVHFTGDGYVRILMSSKVYFLNLTTTVKALLSTEEKKAGVKFEPVAARFGYIPIPVSAVPSLVKKFQQAAENSLEKVRNKTKEVTVTENSISLKK